MFSLILLTTVLLHKLGKKATQKGCHNKYTNMGILLQTKVGTGPVITRLPSLFALFVLKQPNTWWVRWEILTHQNYKCLHQQLHNSVITAPLPHSSETYFEHAGSVLFYKKQLWQITKSHIVHASFLQSQAYNVGAGRYIISYKQKRLAGTYADCTNTSLSTLGTHIISFNQHTPLFRGIITLYRERMLINPLRRLARWIEPSYKLYRPRT